MFYHLLVPLADQYIFFNLFKYITFRAGGAAVTAFVISFILGPLVIKWVKKRKMVEEIRTDGPTSHSLKAGTPTMGGLIIIPALLIGTILWARLDNIQTWILVIATLWMGGVGALDDWLKTRDKKGLAPCYKLIGQVTLGLLIGAYLYFYPETISEQFALHRTETTLPFFKHAFLQLAPFGLWILFLAVTTIVVTGSSNAVNLTDGLDGLAIGLIGIVAVGLAVLAYVSGHAEFASYLNITFLPGSGEISVYCAAMVGAALGFLWVNANPAMVFMGDTGALALGAGVGVASILIKKELFLFILGGVFVAETLSVMVQRYYFKATRKMYGEGRRWFRMAPLHHHFEVKWGSDSRLEPRLVIRFWIIGILLLFITIASFKVR